MVVPVVVVIYDDRSFDLQLKTRRPRPSGQDGGLPKGSGRLGADAPIATIDRQQLREVAVVKFAELNSIDLDAAERILAGTAAPWGSRWFRPIPPCQPPMRRPRIFLPPCVLPSRDAPPRTRP
jgi:ribosomal protein L11